MPMLMVVWLMLVWLMLVVLSGLVWGTYICFMNRVFLRGILMDWMLKFVCIITPVVLQIPVQCSATCAHHEATDERRQYDADRPKRPYVAMGCLP